jgi:SAM-dependent methyltransferase
VIPRDILHLLACPSCQAPLDAGDAALTCAGCGHVYPQPDERWIALMPPEDDSSDARRWSARQAECDAWYLDLVRRPDGARACYDRDYRPYAEFLATLGGRVLDLGGGAGVTARYLRRADAYVVVEPSTMWASPVWSGVATDEARRLPTTYVRGVGEALPFASATFDAVVSFWSLNHVRDPARVLAQCARVLRAGGVLFLVLEDVEPRWSDLALPSFRRRGAREWLGVAVSKARASSGARAFPLQSDHIRIEEAALAGWCGGDFRLEERAWPERYLTLRLRRAPAVSP